MFWPPPRTLSFFFFNDTATTEIYTLSLHDALPIWPPDAEARRPHERAGALERDRAPGAAARFECAHADDRARGDARGAEDRKSTRLNSSHSQISYAVFCLKKKKKWYLMRSKPQTQV